MILYSTAQKMFDTTLHQPTTHSQGIEDGNTLRKDAESATAG